jgi:DNA-binding winged helix-turn-helix (wHTH) protein
MRRRTLTFGRLALDARTRRLTRDGERVDLQQQPFELLMLLVEQADAIVTREAIRARIWPDTVIEYDQSINYAVRQIRVALGPDAGRLQTVPRRGYRFVGPVRDGGLAQRVNRTVVTAAAALAAAFAIVFGAGVVAAHTPAGAFIYVHIVHPDRCPYVRMLIPSLRNS